MHANAERRKERIPGIILQFYPERQYGGCANHHQLINIRKYISNAHPTRAYLSQARTSTDVRMHFVYPICSTLFSLSLLSWMSTGITSNPYTAAAAVATQILGHTAVAPHTAGPLPPSCLPITVGASLFHRALEYFIQQSFLPSRPSFYTLSFTGYFVLSLKSFGDDTAVFFKFRDIRVQV